MSTVAKPNAITQIVVVLIVASTCRLTIAETVTVDAGEQPAVSTNWKAIESTNLVVDSVELSPRRMSLPASADSGRSTIRFTSADERSTQHPDSFIQSPIETEVPEVEYTPNEYPAQEFVRPIQPSGELPLMESPIVETLTDRETFTAGEAFIPPIVESPRRLRLSRMEQLFDGGDQFPVARVAPDWSVSGLNAEDTIAHYDTLGGTTEVSASNRVSIYSPRFAAVRQVRHFSENKSVNPAGRVRMMSAPNESGTDAFADIVKVDEGPIEHIRDTTPQGLQDRNPGRTVDHADIAKATTGHGKPFTGIQVTQADTLLFDAIPHVATFSQELIISNEIQTVQVILDSQQASLAAKTTSANEVFEYKLPNGKARMRVTKLASTTAAHVGDTVRFTIRFDNVGDEAVGNVAIMDNLTTRFVYMPDSQTCDTKAEFSTEANQSLSHLLRWDIDKTLEPGQGGTIRFSCIVR